LEESALENDEITDQDGIRFLVNERDQVYFNSVKIDYVKTLFGDGQFKVLHV
jgi:Fe-S cluster assembly iron-binding protein IscA